MSLDPVGGPLVGGNLLTISGGIGSSADITLVEVGGQRATLVDATGSSVVVQVPTGVSAGLRDVWTYSATYGIARSLPVNTYEYYAAPIILSVSPNSVAVGSGTSGPITVAGIGVSSAAGDIVAVSVCGVAAFSFSVVNSNTVTMFVNVQSTAAVCDVVTVSTSRGTATLVGQYQFIGLRLVPASGPFGGGTLVTISRAVTTIGNGVDITSVKFCNDVAVIQPGQTTSSVVVTAPSHAVGSCTVTMVSTVRGTSTATNAFEYYAADIIPSSGPNAGGQRVTILFSSIYSPPFTELKLTNIPVQSIVEQATGYIIAITGPAASVASSLGNVAFKESTSTPHAFGVYTYQAAPRVNTVQPNQMNMNAALTVTITGYPASPIGAGGSDIYRVVSAQDVEATIQGQGSNVVTIVPGWGTECGQLFIYSHTYGVSNASFCWLLPTVNALTFLPDSGPRSGGNVVTLTCSPNKAAAYDVLRVVLDTDETRQASVLSQTISTITVSMPPWDAARAAVPSSVLVFTQSGAMYGGTPYTYVAGSVVLAVTPMQLPYSGGRVVTITSSVGFSTTALDITAVLFGTVPGTALIASSSTRVAVTAPSSSAVGVLAGVDVNVTVLSTSFGVSDPGQLSYLSAPQSPVLRPNVGPVVGEFLVTLETTTQLHSFDVVSARLCCSGFACPEMLSLSRVTTPSSVSLDLLMPPHALASCSLTVDSSAFGTTTVLMKYVATSVTSIQPHVGYVTGGTLVTVHGTAFVFGGNIALRFSNGSQEATTSATYQSTTSLLAIVPAFYTATNNTWTTVSVALDGVNFIANNSVRFLFYHTASHVNALQPNSGPWNGGTVVTVSGTGFAESDTLLVRMNTPITNVNFPQTAMEYHWIGTYLSPTQIRFVTQSVAQPNIGNCAVSLDAQQFNGSVVPFVFYEYPILSSLNPPAGPFSGQTDITILGSGIFNSNNIVVQFSMDWLVWNASATFVSSTMLRVISPAVGRAGSAYVSVAFNGQNFELAAFNFSFYVAPTTVSALSPATGAMDGGTTVTLLSLSQSFRPSALMVVSFSATNVTYYVNVTYLTRSLMVVVSPAVPFAGAYEVKVSLNWQQFSNAGIYFIYTQPPDPIGSISKLYGTIVCSTDVVLSSTFFPNVSDYQLVLQKVTDGRTLRFTAQYVSDTFLTASIPSLSQQDAGLYSVSLQTGQTLYGSNVTFELFLEPAVTAVLPALVQTDSGAIVTVHGNGFKNISAQCVFQSSPVVLGPTTVAALFISDRELLCRVPNYNVMGSRTLTVAVTVDALQCVQSSWQTLQMVDVLPVVNVSLPHVVSVSPSTMSARGLQRVTIVGALLGSGTDVTAVTLCGVNAAIVVQSASAITVVAGASSAAVHGDVVVRSATAGLSVLTNAFSYYAELSALTDAGSIVEGASVSIAVRLDAMPSYDVVIPSTVSCLGGSMPHNVTINALSTTTLIELTVLDDELATGGALDCVVRFGPTISADVMFTSLHAMLILRRYDEELAAPVARLNANVARFIPSIPGYILVEGSVENIAVQLSCPVLETVAVRLN
eukprot:TRINITY_DN3526_c0_g1_i1.p1 TRINITY_DN3526_c0_g1~~TRINITY_DN3526_c0_g1_i1.p1  ORF type:complete len:1543 (-),score=381.70 TRINITY_DN3526_c0_g1_i1:3547-8175(-)